MSDTITDMPKVAQMLDAGWQVRIYKGPLGSYEVRARHRNATRMHAALKALRDAYPEPMALDDVVEYHTHDGWLMTDDFTPEQALTRMAYKVFGEIL